MGRPRTGSVREHAMPDGSKHYDIRLTMPDGTRSKLECMPPWMDEGMARREALRRTHLAAQETHGPTAPAKKRANGAGTIEARSGYWHGRISSRNKETGARERRWVPLGTVDREVAIERLSDFSRQAEAGTLDSAAHAQATRDELVAENFFMKEEILRLENYINRHLSGDVASTSVITDQKRTHKPRAKQTPESKAERARWNAWFDEESAKLDAEDAVRAKAGLPPVIESRLLLRAGLVRKPASAKEEA